MAIFKDDRRITHRFTGGALAGHILRGIDIYNVITNTGRIIKCSIFRI